MKRDQEIGQGNIGENDVDKMGINVGEMGV